MHVQTTSAGQEASKEKSTQYMKSCNSDSRICIRIGPDYPESQIKPKNKTDYCNFIFEVCKKLSKLLQKDKTKKVEYLEKRNKLKVCYCVLCCGQKPSVLIPTIPPVTS